MTIKQSVSFFILFYFLSFSVFSTENTEQDVANTLDEFHRAASNAEGDRYFSLLTDNAVFMGTDPTERWTKLQFKQFAMPIFNQHRGWLYVVKQRNITLIADKKSAYFDEVLENSNYGLCRGSGVLILTPSGWKIAQYNLSLPIPNDIAKAVVAQIKSYEANNKSTNLPAVQQK